MTTGHVSTQKPPQPPVVPHEGPNDPGVVFVGLEPPEAESLPQRIWHWLRRPIRLPQLLVIVIRVAVIIIGAVIVKASATHLGPLALLTAALFAAAVIVVFHWLDASDKRWWAYLLYLAAIAAGVLLLKWTDVSTDLGMSGPVAMYASIGLFLTGLTGITKRWRKHSSAGWCGAGASALALLAGIVGVRRFEESYGPVVLAAAAILLYGGLTLSSGALLVVRTDRTDQRYGGQGHQLRDYVLWRWWQRLSRAWRLLVAVVPFAVVALLAIQLVRRHHLDASGVFWGAIIVVGLMVLIASNVVADSAAVASVASLVFALTAASAPYTGAGATAPVERGDTTLVALGDSFISGEGAESFYADTNVQDRNECRRAPTAYASVLLNDKDLRPTQPFDSLIFLACSGAKSKNLTTEPQHPNDPIGGPPQLRAAGLWEIGATQLEQLDQRLRIEQPARGLVLVSLGGNDAGFGRIISTCISLGSCDTVVDRWTKDLADIKPGLRAAFSDLRAVVGDQVPVLLIPYPIPLAPQRCDESVLFASEHRSLYEFVSALNATIAAVATEPRLGFSVLGWDGTSDAEYQSWFDGHRVCDSSKGWAINYVGVNPVAGALRESANPRNWLHNSFHPNEAGHAIIAEHVRQWIDDQGDRQRWAFSPPAQPYRARTVQVSEMKLEPAEMRAAEAAGGCPVEGTDWEPGWSSCQNGKYARRFFPWAVLAVGAAWSAALVVIVLFREELTARVRRGRRRDG